MVSRASEDTNFPSHVTHDIIIISNLQESFFSAISEDRIAYRWLVFRITYNTNIAV